MDKIPPNNSAVEEGSRLYDVLNRVLASVDYICIFPKASFVHVAVTWPDGKISNADGSYEDLAGVIEKALYRTVDSDG